MRKKLELALLVLVLVLVMVSCKKTDPIILPDASDLQVITATKIEENREGPTASITSKKDIMDTIKLIQEETKPARKQLDNDIPANAKNFRKMEIFYGKNEKMTLYLYQNKRFHIKKPYEGVWGIDSDTFNKLIGTM